MGDDLFESAKGGATQKASPLADRMRPRSLDEFIGQEHIVGPGRLLRRAIQRDRISSIILSGPPGTGKTTLARVIAGSTQSRFLSLNAVLTGVQAIRDAIESAKRERELYDRKTILFVDEVHRWNKAQQDALLPWVENGTIVLIGATTENPFFEVNRALVSRSRVFQLRSLGDEDLAKAAAMALADRDRGYGRWEVRFEDGALGHLVKMADGDARSLLNALELAVETSVDPWPPADGAPIRVGMEAAEESIQRRAVLYDRDGDYHYDAASALIKSVRGSDPDAALYWLARMVYAGEDPRFIFRRLLISAAEDVGLADPAAIGVVESCAAAYERIGLPEGQFHLAQATLYLATAPKSNSTLGYYDALASVENERAEVPDRLKDASRDAEGMGHGVGYLYPHAFREHWTAQQYLPDALKGAVFYQPGSRGYEAQVRDEVLGRRDLQLAAWLAGEDGFGTARAAEVPAAGRSWDERADSGAQAALVAMRDALLEDLAPRADCRCLVLNADDGILLRAMARRCPDGLSCALASGPEAVERLEFAFRDVEACARPDLGALADPASAAVAARALAGHGSFDAVLAHGFLGRGADFPDPEALAGLGSCAREFPGAAFALAERANAGRGVLPSLAAAFLPEATLARFRDADARFFEAEAERGPGEEKLRGPLAAAGLHDLRTRAVNGTYRRTLEARHAEAWLSPRSAYGATIGPALSAPELDAVLVALAKAFGAGPVAWPYSWIIALGVA